MSKNESKEFSFKANCFFGRIELVKKDFSSVGSKHLGEGFYCACIGGGEDGMKIIQFLMDKVDVGYQKMGLGGAVRTRNIEKVKLIAEKIKADCSSELIEACAFGSVEMARALLECSEVNAYNNEAMYGAVFNDNKELVDLLISGTDVNILKRINQIHNKSAEYLITIMEARELNQKIKDSVGGGRNKSSKLI